MWRVWIFVLLVTAGCTPRVHTVAPYRDDPAAGDALSARAAATCAAHGRVVPPAPFHTDGCSAWPDATWGACCVEHDVAYWCGGTADERLAADRELRACVDAVAGGGWATVMYGGVRLGGWDRLPLPWRWGFGWPWRARVPVPPTWEGVREASD